MGKRRERTLARLRAAAEELTLVRLERRDGFDTLEGYVLAIGEEWLVLAVLDPRIVLDGHSLLRLDDVRAVRRPSSGDMAERALTLRGAWPPGPPVGEVELTSTRALLESLRESPSVTVHLEEDEPDICYIGKVLEVGKSALRLQEVTPRGVWNARATRYPLEGITRLDIGGSYEEAILLVAGEIPSAE